MGGDSRPATGIAGLSIAGPSTADPSTPDLSGELISHSIVGPHSKPLSGSEFTHHLCWIAMLPVDRLIHRAHVLGRHFAGQRLKSLAHLRPTCQGLIPHQRHGLIWREVVTIVLERSEAELLN